MKTKVVIGTRGSPLALAQTREVVQLLKKVAPKIRSEVVPIKTEGDKLHDVGTNAIEGKSLFTKEIEQSLIDEKIDIAVHSMKDVTAELPAGLTIAAVPERVNPRDAFISRRKQKFEDLPARASVGTSSPRRKAQLLAKRSDLEIVDMHGNIGTRLRKLEQSECDAIVLAAAGLIRLGLEKKVTEFFSPEVMLPAVGQGALAIETREDDSEVRLLLSKLDHKETHMAVEAERAFASRLGANCRTPIAAYARFKNGKLTIDGMIAAASGKMVVRGQIISDKEDANKVGQDLADSLLEKGAGVVLEVS